MFKPEKMIKVNVVLLEAHVAALTARLGQLGLLHLVSAPAQVGLAEFLRPVDHGSEISRADHDVQRLSLVLEQLEIAPQSRVGEPEIPEAEMESSLAVLEKELASRRQTAASLSLEIVQLKERLAVLADFPVRTVSLGELRNLGHLHAIAGLLPATALAAAKEKLAGTGMMIESHVARDPEVMGLLVLCPRRERWAIEEELKKAGMTFLPIPADAVGNAVEELSRAEIRLAAAQGELDDNRVALRALAQEQGGRLCIMLTQAKNHRAVLQAAQNFGRAASVCCVSGWMPAARADEVQAVVAAVTDGTGVVRFVAAEADEMVRAGREQVPVRFSDNAFLKPFRLLITIYGIPRYDEVEPSLFFALSFVLMFGLMFGDAGHGLVIILLGAWLALTRRPFPETLRSAGWLMVMCGISATCIGIAAGSYFGFEPKECPAWLSGVSTWLSQIHPSHHAAEFPRLFEPMQDAMKLFAVSLGIGILCMSIGLVVNVINKFRVRRWADAILDKSGVAGIAFYWGALGLGVKAAVSGQIHGWELLLLLAPVVLLALREPLLNFLHREKHLVHDGWLIYGMEALVESFEVMNGFLSNTLSFIRIGAFALSHAAMCSMIFVVAEMIKELPLGGFWYLLLVIVGNVFIIGLEGMVVTIQCMRLQYYEFFSRFFPGDGLPYKPFSFEKMG
jgi:V/A-type H+-transporting ATPase subunit I